ncbi:MAG: NADH-quinone oxidoreductase subunit N [Anaerolineae bacterium]|nr:NADH-quinone oxidoreductase subunit N [Anaerolineae bacterium]
MEPFDFLQSLPTIAPIVGLTITAILVLALDLILPESQRRNIALVTAACLFGTVALMLIFWMPNADTEGLYWGGMIRFDILTWVFSSMVIIGAGITALITIDVEGLNRRGEFYLVLVVATLGACLITGAADLIIVFLGLETLTIPLYVLAAFHRDDKRSSESGMKYFLYGSFASAIMLYGFSLMYGFTGHTNLYAIAEYMQTDAFQVNLLPILIAIALIVVGFGFKISAAPFHFWTPDVYEGAPTPVTAYLSVASKAASFALLIRFALTAFPSAVVINGAEVQMFWTNLATALAILSMIVGNVLALAQKNIKRLLAYSSIAQAGYTLIGVAALAGDGRETAVAGITYYMLMYTFTNLLAFGVVIMFTNATGKEDIKDLAGLSQRSPWMALLLTIGLLSLAGVPPAAGFFGKYFLFQAAVESGLTWLALFGILMSIVALYYYLTVIKVMYVDKSEDADKPISISPVYGWTMGVVSLVVVLLGTFAVQPVFNWVLQGAQMLFANL